MNKEDKLKEYYKKYQKNHREKYNEYGRDYYQKHKEKFKKYYDDYKKNRLAKKNGTYVKTKITKHQSKRELERRRWERKLRINEEKRLAFIAKLKQTGELPPDDTNMQVKPDDTNMPPE